MPLNLSETTTPAGRRVAKAESAGEVTVADAQAFNQAMGPGGVYHGLPLLGVMQPGASLSVESRRVFTETSNQVALSAVVIPTPAMRVMINFMVKASALRGGRATRSSAFSNEAEALAWLDQQLAADGH